MKLLSQGVALAVVGAGLAAIPALQVQAQAAEPSLVQQMKSQAQGAVALRSSTATGKVGFVSATGSNADLMPSKAAATGAEAATKASSYLDKYAAAFGAASGQLVQSSVQRTDLGWTVAYTQKYEGLDVFGSMIKANVDNDGDLTAVNGFAAPGINLSTTPRLSATEAGKRALTAVRYSPAKTDDGRKADLSGIKATNTELVVYRLGAIKGEVGDNVLAYQVEVTNKANIRDMVFVDANTGKAVNRYSLDNDALERELYEGSPNTTPVWVEGQDESVLNEDQKKMVDSTGEAYWLFKNSFGRDSWDAAGAKMKIVNNDPTIACPNANWNGVTTNYCDGVSSDDVVSHEWAHAYTERTSGLIYQFQSGALNESYSDVWGETLDLINGREDEDEGDINAKRPDGQCSKYTRGNIGAVINSPVAQAGPCAGAIAASFGPVFDAAGTTADVVVALDAANPAGPTVNDGCTAFTNPAGTFAGKWAYVDRGTCPFTDKIANAENAGADGIVFGNTTTGQMTSVAGVSDLFGLMVTNADGTRIKTAGAVNMTVRDIDTDPKADSYRWLMGEKSDAFGGAIRDMWNPTCYGDPGKVTDAEYNCDPNLDDAGGVHGNSAVPNHAYALVVDGGTYNGQTITGLGLDKAAHIWWRAQTAYLTPASNFVDAADALEKSCVDMTGQPITKLTTQANATPVAATPVAAADCASVAAAIAATQMRTPPAQCNFQPAFSQDTPATCGDGFATSSVYKEDFEDGLTGWATSFETVYEGGIHQAWEADTTAPTGNGPAHPGGVAYGPAPDKGACTEGAGDFSSRDSIASPVIELPTPLRAPKLTFDHYLATEGGYDGGNVKVSINGGAYQVINAEDYIFNGNNFELQPTNPLGGEEGFSGTDGGEADGSWVQSQVDLGSLGAAAGDTVQFRFDIGRDGCGGNDGWYVDNVQVVQCQLKTKVSAVHLPEPSTFGTASSVNVTVERDGNTGPAPAGSVTLTKADGTSVGSGTLAAGSATIALPADLAVGVYAMKANYSGDGNLAPSTGNVTVTVKAGPTTPPPGKDETKTKVKVKPAKVERNEAFKVIVTVKSDDDVTGKVKVMLDGKKVDTIKLKAGRAVLKVKKNLKLGKHKVVAKYLGTDDFKRSSDNARLRVVR